MNESNPLEVLEGVTVEDVSGLSKVSGLPYECYITIPKGDVAPLFKVLESLSKVTNDMYGKSVYVEADAKNIIFRYNNDPYLFECRVDNYTQKPMKGFCISISNFRKLFNSVNSNLILVQEGGLLNVCLGDNLIFVETSAFEAKEYDFKFAECSESLDLAYCRGFLKDFVSLMSSSNNVAEKNVICKGGVSYFNAGAVMGKARSFFGDHSIVVSKVVLDAIVHLSEGCKSGMFLHLEGSEMTLEFSKFARLRCPVITDEAVFQQFMSPLFLQSFESRSSVLISNEALVQLLTVVNVMDFYTSFVKLDFGRKELQVTTYLREGAPKVYSFPYFEGDLEPTSLNVAIPLVMSVLSKTNLETKYSTVGGNLIVELPDVTYCVRSNS